MLIPFLGHPTEIQVTLLTPSNVDHGFQQGHANWFLEPPA